MKWLSKLFIGFIVLTATPYAKLKDAQSKEAIVKIYATAKVPNYLQPWSTTMRSGTGSGAIIAGGYILTNAHVVANSTFLEVERYGHRKRYIAKVFAVAHQVDLALLKVEDKGFFKGVTPLNLGGLPKIEQRIVVYGYPMGGSTLSATTGVVSRIEHNTYAHSGEMFLSIQVDAAVNPGNSGGPAISDGKIVGVVMQVISRSQNIGYLVPTITVKHFLQDVKDGKHDGFADLGLNTQNLENPSLRKHYNLNSDVTGVLVNDIVSSSTAHNLLQKGDVITAIDGHNIENDGTVAFRDNEYTHYHYYADAHQMGQDVKLDIIRGEQKKQVEVPLLVNSDGLYLVKTTRYDEMPRYAVYGGYVFSPLTRNLINATKRNRLELSYLASQWRSKDKKEVVVLLKVLATDDTRGNNNVAMWVVEKINGKTFEDFSGFYSLLQQSSTPFVVLEDKYGKQVIIDVKKAKASESEIMKKYNIEYSHSIDLRTKK